MFIILKSILGKFHSKETKDLFFSNLQGKLKIVF